MKMQWFRMYHDMIEDPKIGTLNDAQFRLWVEILCLSCSAGNCGDTELTIDEINWKLRRNVTGTLQELLDRNLVVFVDGRKGHTIKVVNWDKRQFLSDNSTERVRKYREKTSGKNETLQKRFCNPTDTDTDTDTDTKTTIKPYKFILADGTTYKPDQKYLAELSRLYPSVDLDYQFSQMEAWCLSNPKKRKTRKGATRFINSWLSRAAEKMSPSDDSFQPTIRGAENVDDLFN